MRGCRMAAAPSMQSVTARKASDHDDCGSGARRLAQRVMLGLGSGRTHGRRHQIAQAGGKSRQWIADLLEIDDLPGHIDDLLAQTRVDILVTNAATFIRQSALDLTFQRWREVQTVNVDAAWLLCTRIG